MGTFDKSPADWLALFTILTIAIAVASRRFSILGTKSFIRCNKAPACPPLISDMGCCTGLAAPTTLEGLNCSVRVFLSVAIDNLLAIVRSTRGMPLTNWVAV